MALGAWITSEDRKAVDDVLVSVDLMSGKQVALFEAELAAYLGKRHVVCVSSGTAALECAYWATMEGIGLRNENFIAALSAGRSANTSFHTKYDPDGNGAAILGLAPDNYKRRVLDAAHALGTTNLPGEVHCYSFNANKFLSCLGGCVATDSEQVAAVCRVYRNHGRDGARVVDRGHNYRMAEMNAALGRSQLRRIDEILARRKQVATWYNGQIKNDPEDRESWFLYPVVCKTPDHGHRSLADFRLFNSATDEDYRTALLPIWPLQTREEVEAIVDKLKPCL